MPYKDPEEQKKYYAEWAKRNRERFKIYQERHKEKDPEKYRLNQLKRFKKYSDSEKGKATAKLWRDQHKDQVNLQRADGRFKLKLKVLEHYGLRCACCGEDHLEFLQIDHINGDGKKHRDSLRLHGGTSTYNWLISNDFPEGFRTLCANCNQSRGAYGYCPHEHEGELHAPL